MFCLFFWGGSIEEDKILVVSVVLVLLGWVHILLT